MIKEDDLRVLDTKADIGEIGAYGRWGGVYKMVKGRDLEQIEKHKPGQINEIVSKIVRSLLPSESYAIIHHDRVLLMNIVMDYTRNDKSRKALVFTRTRPKIIIEKNKISKSVLKKIDIYWLSTMITTEEKTISPTELPKINREIIEFLTNAGDKGLILFDGLEYLTIHNGFEATLKFMQSIRDFVALHSGTILYALDPKAFSEKEQHLIFRELTFLDVD